MASSYPDSVRYLYAIGNELKGAKLGLERITPLLAALGHPEAAARFVHVAGTNGKGSACAMIEAGIRAGGFRTGLFTSPHLVQPTERIRINGVPVSEDAFTGAFARVHAVADPEAHPSYFETVTLMAFLLFRDAAVDWVVLETGLGGRLDATNVVTPEICAITAIDFDHQEFLGNTLEQIAGEKAGIIKAGVPVVVSSQAEAARGVVLARAGAVRAPVVETSAWKPVRDLVLTEQGSRYQAGGHSIQCPLAGMHQVENSLTAAMVLDRLGIPLEGMASAVWPGRLELVSEAPAILLDGAHNPAGVRTLADHLRRFYSGREITLVFAAMRDKPVGEMLSVLSPLALSIVMTAPDSSRAMTPEELRAVSPHPRTTTLPSVREAVDWAKAQAADQVIVFAGSLFLVGEARALFVQ